MLKKTKIKNINAKRREKAGHRTILKITLKIFLKAYVLLTSFIK